MSEAYDPAAPEATRQLAEDVINQAHEQWNLLGDAVENILSDHANLSRMIEYAGLMQARGFDTGSLSDKLAEQRVAIVAHMQALCASLALKAEETRAFSDRIQDLPPLPAGMAPLEPADPCADAAACADGACSAPAEEPAPEAPVAEESGAAEEPAPAEEPVA